MGCQSEIANKIIDKKGDYLLAVKENQKGLHHDLLDSFRFLKTEKVLTDIDTGHSHISEVDKWKNLSTLIKIESERFHKSTGKIEQQTRYYISSKDESAEYFQRNVRSHWSIENKLHWMLDMVFHEDASRKRAGNTAQNFSMVTKIALKMLKMDTFSKRSIKTKRKRASWDGEYIKHLLKF